MKARNTTLLIGVFFILMLLQTNMPQTGGILQGDARNQTAINSLNDQLGLVNSYSPSQVGFEEWNGISSGLPTQVYGNRTDIFTDNRMVYFPGNVSTSSTYSTIPIGPEWEGHYLDVEFSNLRENRTWFYDPGMEDNAQGNWTLGWVSVGGGAAPSAYWVSDSHDGGQYAIEFEIAGGGDPGLGERAYARQNVSVPRGDVVWAGFSLDYNIRTASTWGAEGFVSVYVSVEAYDYTQRVWQISFGDIPAENVWYNSGLIPIPDLSIFNLTDGLTIEVGIYSSYGGGYSPDLNPYTKVDNVELYIMTECAPTDINLQTNGIDVLNYTLGESTIYGVGHITDFPGVGEKWINPLQVNYSWTPTPSFPDPNRPIAIDFDVKTNLYARGQEMTVRTQDPSAFGETFSVRNGTSVNYTTWFNVAPPDGYENRFYFNVSLPIDRDVFWVGSPRLTEVNFTYSWDEGGGPLWYANISAFKALDYYGYWLIESRGANMIKDVLMKNVSSGISSQFLDIRMDNQILFSTVLDSRYVGSKVNLTIYAPSGEKWHSEIVAVDANGYANTSSLFFGSTASAGEWLFQAFSNNSIAGSPWNETGFFQRSFNVVHKSTFTLLSPADAVSTYIANVTYPDLFLVRVRINDSDIPLTVVSGGLMTVNWTTGTKNFGYSNGVYLITLDSSELPSSGKYILNIDWTHPHFDNQNKVLTLNINLLGSIDIVEPDTPTVDGPVGYNQTFVVRFSDYFNTGLESATMYCNWTETWSVSPVVGSPGQYRFWLNTSTTPIGEYVVEVTGESSFVIPQTYLVYFQIRELYTRVDYVQNVLDIPLGEAESFLVEWIDTDHDVPLSGMSSYILCNWTGNHIGGDTNYTVSEISPGVYNITIYTLDYDNVQSYPVRIDLQAPLIQNHSIDIEVVARSHTTDLIPDQAIQQTSYGDDIIVLVAYQDTDLGLGISNATFQVQVTVASSDLPTLTFTSIQSAYGIGHYNITIPTSQWATAGWKNLTITFTWVGSQKYEVQVWETSVRVVGRLTDLYLDIAPVATYFLDNLTFSTVYFDIMSSSGISNSTNHVFVSIVPIGGTNPILQSDFYWFEIGITGVYEFHLNSSLAQDVGTFSFMIYFLWESGVSPLYENKSLTVNLLILERPTYIDYTPASSTPFGENAIYTFSYIDSLSTNRVQNSSSLLIVLNETGVDFILSYDINTRIFTITIDTADLNQIGIIELHLNVTWIGEPFYKSVLLHKFTIPVIPRGSQLELAPFTSGQYLDNVTLEFTFIDVIAGNSLGLTGVLTLDVGSGYYTVAFLGDGVFIVEINTTVYTATGSFMINASVVYTGSNFVSNAYYRFSFTILPRATQLAYSSPENTPYLNNVTFTITYTDDAAGAGIASASIALSCATAAESLIENANYWVTYEGLGVYTIRVNSSALGSPMIYTLNVLVSRSGEPFYVQGSRTVNAAVTTRPTQLVILKTPGSTPFLDNITIQFRYIDRSTSQLIPIGKSAITLSHGSGPIIMSSSAYSVQAFGTYYEISFNSTVLDGLNLVSNHPIYLLLNISSISPFYAVRSTSLLASTVQRITQLLFPLVSETPYSDNISVYLDYVDFATSVGILGAIVTMDSSNVTIPTYYVTELGNGQYLIEIPTLQFGTTGVVYINVSVSKSGVPFYSARTATNIPATIRRIQTSLLADVPGAGSVPVGDIIVINLTLADTDHDTPILGAILSTNWTNTSAVFSELGNGLYTLSLNTSGLSSQAYSFSIAASKSLYSTSNITVTILPGAATVQITLDQSIYYAEWGEEILIRATVRETYYFTPVPGMVVTILWESKIYSMNGIGNGTYVLLLDTSESDFGNFEPIVTASRQFYQTRQRAFSLIVSKAPGQIVPEGAFLTIYYNDDLDFYIYLNDTLSNAPVTGATVSMEWNNSLFILTANGTPGYYMGSIDSMGFEIGQYSLIISAFAQNHNFLDFSVGINVAPIPTQLGLKDNPASIVVYYGNQILLRVFYNDSYYGGIIDGANVSYVLGGLNGVLVQDVDGSYVGTIDTSALGAQSIYLRLIASKDNYATNTRTIVTNILQRPTSISVDDQRQSGYHLDNITFTFHVNDSLSNTGLESATVEVEWDGPSADVIDIGGGVYSITFTLNLTQPREYPITMTFKKNSYETISLKVFITLNPTPAEILAPSRFSVPINEQSSITIQVINHLDNSTIVDVDGIANWAQLGESALTLLPNGNYSLLIPGDLPLGTYSVLLTFPSSKYAISPWSVDIIIRRIITELITGNTTISTSPGSALDLEITFRDLDHNEGISGATVSVVFEGNVITYYENLLTESGGVYRLLMLVNAGETFYITITFSKDLYETQVVVYEVKSDITGEQALIQAATVGGGSALILASILIVLYIRVWSVPKQIRAINRMLKKLEKGKIPAPAAAPMRSLTILAAINEEIRSVGLRKDSDDIIGESIEINIPEVEELLTELAALTGLGQIEIDAFRADLARMKSSERPGFLREVIEQEKARRADDIAKAKEIEEPERVAETLEQKPEDIAELREKLLAKGMAPEEIDVILEEARNLSKADLKALLDSLGIRLD